MPHVNCYLLLASRLTYRLISCLANHSFAFSIEGNHFFEAKTLYCGIEIRSQGKSSIFQKILNSVACQYSSWKSKYDAVKTRRISILCIWQLYTIWRPRCILRGRLKKPLSLCRKSSVIIGSSRERAFLLQKAFSVQEIYRFRSRKPGEFVQVNGS